MFANSGYFLRTLTQGLSPTVELTVGGIIVATILSFAAGIASTSRSRIVRIIVRVYVEGLRGTSEVVQLFWIYWAVPMLIGFQLVPLWAGVVVLGLNHGAYGAEIVRGAINAVPREQHEGAIALNLTPAQRMRRVILPQAIVEMLPPFNTLFIQLLKATALVSMIDVADITYQANNVLALTYSGQMPLILLMALVMYLIMAVIITLIMRQLERFAAARLGRKPPSRAGHLGRAAPGSV